VNRLDLPWIRQRLADHHARPIDAPRRAAVATIFRPHSSPGCCDLLFILRAEQEQDPWSGHMAFPGGRIEENDATPLDAARRETREEVGIDLAQSAELLGSLDDLQASAGGRVVPLSITPFVFALESQVETVPNEEVEEIHWVPVTKLLDPASGSTVPYVLAGQRYDLPCFRVFDRVIWGLTYQMLMLLFTVLDWEIGR
jgi:8-oxo-dGTP pyrophosphatase MutT (NUDIX family)